MGKYYSSSTTTQTDESVSVGSAENVLGPGAVQTQPGSFAIGADAHVGEVTYNQFPEEVRTSLTDMIEAVETSVQQSGQSSRAATDAVAAALETQNTGAALPFVEIVKYAALAAVGIVLARRFL